MNNEKKITFVSDNDLLNIIEAELLFSFEFEGNKYLLYTKNEKDYEGKDIVYPGKIVIINDRQYIKNVNEEENKKIKDIIRCMSNYSYGDENA